MTIVPFHTGDKSQMLVGVSGVFVQCERGGFFVELISSGHDFLPFGLGTNQMEEKVPTRKRYLHTSSPLFPIFVINLAVQLLDLGRFTYQTDLRVHPTHPTLGKNANKHNSQNIKLTGTSRQEDHHMPCDKSCHVYSCSNSLPIVVR